MITRAALAPALAWLCFATPLTAHAQPGHLVLNGDIIATLKSEDGTQEFGGRINGYLILREQSLEQGAQVEALNIAMFGVDQQLLTRKPSKGKPTGVVGFSATGDGNERQRLEYDKASGAFVGKIHGRIDMPQFYELAELRIDPEIDYVEIPTMEAVIEVRLALGNLSDLTQAREKPIETQATVDIGLTSRASRSLGMREFEIEAKSRFVRVQLVFWPWIEIARRLCIQPVRILSFSGGFPFPFFHLSGDGLAFGRPGNNTQWAKADVIFTYRDWITLFQPKFRTLTAGEAADLLDEVDEDDCIEVYFVDNFDPQALWGGGATFGLGLASSKVISSDENADFGVDLTHLAHEMGHVLALDHPPSNSSTNTLMCPSGFNNDNPRRNSQENEINLSNPLLTFAIKIVSPGADCQNSGDCGACP